MGCFPNSAPQTSLGVSWRKVQAGPAAGPPPPRPLQGGPVLGPQLRPCGGGFLLLCGSPGPSERVLSPCLILAAPGEPGGPCPQLCEAGASAGHSSQAAWPAEWGGRAGGRVPSLRTSKYGQCLQRRRHHKDIGLQLAPAPSLDSARTLATTGQPQRGQRPAWQPVRTPVGVCGAWTGRAPGLAPLPLLKSHRPGGHRRRRAAGRSAPGVSWSPGGGRGAGGSLGSALLPAGPPGRCPPSLMSCCLSEGTA